MSQHFLDKKACKRRRRSLRFFRRCTKNKNNGVRLQMRTMRRKRKCGRSHDTSTTNQRTLIINLVYIVIIGQIKNTLVVFLLGRNAIACRAKLLTCRWSSETCPMPRGQTRFCCPICENPCKQKSQGKKKWANVWAVSWLHSRRLVVH